MPPSLPDQLPPIEILGNRTVKLIVGEDHGAVKTFLVDKGLLCYYSGYFEAALKPDAYRESEHDTVELPTEKPLAVSHFLSWLYSKQLPKFDTVEDCFDILCELWTFADRRSVPLLANMVIGRLRDKIVEHWVVPIYHLSFIYEHTTSTSGLRRFVIMVMSKTPSGEVLLMEQTRARWSAAALWDALKAVWDLKMQGHGVMTKDELQQLNLCEYHVHENGVRCDRAGEAARQP